MSDATGGRGAGRRRHPPPDAQVLDAVVRAAAMTQSAADWPQAVCRALVHFAGVRLAAIYHAAGRTIDRVATHGMDGAPLPQRVRRVTQIDAPRLLRYPARHRGRTVGWLVVEPALPTPLPPPLRGVCAELARRLPSLLRMAAEIQGTLSRIRSLENALAVTRTAIDGSPAIIVTWGADPSFAVRFISRSISQFGYTPRDFLSGRLNYASLIHPDDVPGMRRHVASVKAAGGIRYSARYRLRNARGEWRWVESHVVQETHRRRPVELYHGIVLDITDQLAAEASSHLAARSFREIADTIRDVFFVMEYPSLRPLYISPGALTVTGYTAARLAREPGLWRRTAHPDDLAAVVRTLRRCARRGSATLEFRLVHRNGSARWTQMRVAAVRDDRGRVVRITGLHQAIGDRKRAEFESRRREQTEALIARVSTVLLPSRASQLEQRMRRALGIVGTFIGADRCVLRLPAQGRRALAVRAAWIRPGRRAAGPAAEAIPRSLFPAGWTRLAASRPVEISAGRGGRLPPSARAGLRRLGIASVLFIPVLGRKRLQAVVSFASLRGTTPWPPTALRLGRALGRLLLKSVRHAEAAAEARRRERTESLIARISTLLARRRGAPLARAIDRALALVGRFLDVDRILMVRRNRGASVFDEIGRWMPPGLGRDLPTYHNAPADMIPYIWQQVSRDRPIVCASLDDLPAAAGAERRLCASLGVRSLMILPALAWHHVRAFLYCSTCDRTRPWNPDDVRLVRTIGNLIIKAVQHSEAEAETRQRLAFESMVLAISQRLVRASADGIDTAISRGLARLGRGLDVGRVFLLRYAEDRLHVTETHEWHAAGVRSFRREFVRRPVSDFAWSAARTLAGREIVIRTPDDYPPEAAPERAMCDIAGNHSLVFLPITIAGRVHGCIGWAATRGPRSWTEEDLRAGRLVAGLLASALGRQWSEEALRSSEARYRRFTADAPDAIYIVGNDGRVRDANPAACAQAGAPPAVLLGRHVRAFLPSFDRRSIDQAGRRLAAEGASLVTCPFRRADGRRLMAEVRVTPLPGGDALAFVRDVSERHRVERAMLQAATREQERIGRDLHDLLGQQLTGLSYLSQAVGASLRSRGAAEARELDRISELLQRTVRQTRFIAHNLAAVELAERGLADALDRLAVETRSLLGVRCDFESRGVVACSPETARELYLVASEAVNNAARHARPRRIRIVLTTTSRRVALEIADDGHWRTAGRAKQGIGLRVMRHRTALAGGRLMIEPQSPHGTRVLCVVPLRPEMGSAEE